MNEKTYGPSQLASHLEQSFGAEPPHASFASDLAHGRRRLRRARALTSLGGLAVAAVVAGTAVAVPRAPRATPRSCRTASATTPPRSGWSS